MGGARALQKRKKDLPYVLIAGHADDRKAAMEHVHKVNIGKSCLVDRNEVEDYMALLRVLRSYAELSNPRDPKPLNLSVFGGPGSGKSRGVRELVQYCSEHDMGFSAGQIPEFNMSQFTSVSDLAEALHTIRDRCVSGEIPVAFFDEFDCNFAGTPFGWFKYLLMPMQDARFWDKNKQFGLGRCVLVFAGGINRSFQELHGRMRNDEFVTAKGPDFISRLRGYLNIRPIHTRIPLKTGQRNAPA